MYFMQNATKTRKTRLWPSSVSPMFMSDFRLALADREDGVQADAHRDHRHGVHEAEHDE